MLVVRCTAKLLARLKAKPVKEPPPSTTLLGDWYATVLPMRPAHLVLLVNERTRLAAVLPAKPLATLAKRIPDAIAEVLRELGAPPRVLEAERRAMANSAFAKTASRSVLGTMNDFSFNMDPRAALDEEPDLLDVAMVLNRMPLSPLDYGRPDDVASALLGIAGMPGSAGSPDLGRAATFNDAAPIYELKVALRDVAPTIWRRVQVRSGISLARLHKVLQIVMGWTECHLHEFRVGETCYGVPHPELPPRVDARKTVLRDVMHSPDDRLTYAYDFGDGWRHDVVLERVLDAEPACEYPRVMDGERACPPEDCGGASGYVHLLAVLADRRHPQHCDVVEWVGGSLDPEAFDATELNRALRRGWSLPKVGAALRTETTLPRSVVIALPGKKHRS